MQNRALSNLLYSACLSQTVPILVIVLLIAGCQSFSSDGSDETIRELTARYELSPEQQTEVRAILEEINLIREELRWLYRSDRGTRTIPDSIKRQLQLEMDSRIRSVLTPEQLARRGRDSTSTVTE